LIDRSGCASYNGRVPFLKGCVMDFEDNNSNLSEVPEGQGPEKPQGVPPQPIRGLGAGVVRAEKPKSGSGWRVFWTIVLGFSVMANVVLFLMLIGVVGVLMAGQRGLLTEEVIRDERGRAKIAVVTVEGIIHAQAAQDVYRQLKAASGDRYVKGVIVRVNSPGGTISASDQIYKEILKFREEKKKPVIAFMQGVAASGGYYASVACEKIMAEPTTITGSIGVISWYFVVQELLENKLGVLAVTVKAGEKKDWPSSFKVPTQDQLDYMQEKLVTPAFERFVEVVAEGRKGSLTLEDVRRLADGGIFGAKEAVEEKLIDDNGYLDDAVDLIKSMAGIQRADVVQYRKPFSLMDLMSYKKEDTLKISKSTLYELSTPETLYLWSAY
jgi:protease-4